MIRILCIIASMDTGGAETFLMKLFRTIDPQKVKMEFCVGSEKQGFYDEEIEAAGGKIYRTTPKTNGIFKFCKELSCLIKENHFDYVMRIGASSLVCLDLWVARFAGAKCRILRSSNAGTTQGKLHQTINTLLRIPLTSVANIKIAPSKLAAEYTFGKKAADNKVVYLKNGLDTRQFIFNYNRRNQIRKEFEVEDRFVIGHIGRFNIQKNHSYLLEVFAEILKNRPNAVLMLVGKGELKANILDKANKLGIRNRLILTGVRADVPDLLMAMDCLIFPSFYEGMPNVILEAQATGLPCLVSDTITPEVLVSDRVHMASIKSAPSVWADAVEQLPEASNRVVYADILKKHGYDISEVTQNFLDLLEGMCSNAD